jgi:hypothetical protein
VNFGMSRMYQTLADGVKNIQIEIFRSSEEAVAWWRQGSASASNRDQAQRAGGVRFGSKTTRAG